MRKTLSCFLVFALLLTFLSPLSLKATAATSGYYSYEVYEGETIITGFDHSYSGALTIPATLGGYPVTTISSWAFEGCDLSSVTIPNSVTAIEDLAFAFCRMTSVTIPNSVKTIGLGAFTSCSNLTEVTIPDSVTDIGAIAFDYCESLTTVTIGKGLINLGEQAFTSCAQLAEIKVDPKNPVYSSDSNGILYNKDKTTLVKAPTCLSGTFAVPDTVTTICEYAFSWCDLTSVTIPASVTTIATHAFEDCMKLTGIWVNADNPAYSNDDKGVLFNKDKTTLVQAPGNLCVYADVYEIPNTVTTIAEASFAYVLFLSSVIIPDSVTTIGDTAFLCGYMTSVTIPDSVTTIGNEAFSNCHSLTSVTIGNNVTSIGEYAFLWCDELKSVTIPASVTAIGNQAFSYCANLSGISVAPNNSAYSSDDKGVLFNKDKTQLIQAPGGIAGAYAVPDRVEVIQASAFDGCEKLTSVTIPDSVETICECAYYWCTSLESVVIGKNVSVIIDNAFGDCFNLTDVHYGGTQEQWNAILIGEGNEPLTNATIHYNSTGHTHQYPSVPSVTVPASCAANGYAEYVCECGQTYRETLLRLPHSFADGVCTDCGVPECAPGDVDSIAGVNEDDAIYLLQHVMMPDLFQVNQAVDFDGNGALNEDDAIYLLQHVMMPELFPLKYS